LVRVQVGEHHPDGADLGAVSWFPGVWAAGQRVRAGPTDGSRRMDIKPRAEQLGRGAAAVSGKALEGVFAVTARIRPARKPLHPRGLLHTATIERVGLPDPVGVPWIDEPGTSTGLVRVSKAIGLPGALPDIYGLSLRLSLVGGAPADILLATTGLGRLSRFVLFPAQHATQRAYSTLLPYRTASGPMVLAAVPATNNDHMFDLAYAGLGGSWRSFARMIVTETASDDSPSFDPVLNQLPGLYSYGWAAALREGAYRAARRSRSESS
jgi:hypothetical protein